MSDFKPGDEVAVRGVIADTVMPRDVRIAVRVGHLETTLFTKPGYIAPWPEVERIALIKEERVLLRAVRDAARNLEAKHVGIYGHDHEAQVVAKAFAALDAFYRGDPPP